VIHEAQQVATEWASGRLTPGSPPFSGTTTLFQFFGYFGLFCSTVLVLRVLVAILTTA
jgi:hypothetical protein